MILTMTILIILPLLTTVQPYTPIVARGLAIRTLSSSTSSSTRLDQGGMERLQSGGERGKYKAIMGEVSRRRVQVRRKWTKFTDGEEGLLDEKKKKKKKKRDEVMSVIEAFLDVATCEVVYMGVEPHAAVGEGMKELERLGIGKKGRGLGNAIMRKVCGDYEERVKRGDDDPDHDGVNMGDWLREKIEDAGGSPEKVAEVYVGSNPALYLTCKGEEGERVERELKSSGKEASLMECGSVRVRGGGGGRVKDLEGFSEGRWWVQDPSSTLPTKCLREEDKKVVDLCCAPGGKLMQMRDDGRDVVGVELKGKRAEKAKENLRRVGMEGEVNVHVEDGRVWRPAGAEVVDAVLVDAPCSSTGTGRRNSDVMGYEGEDLKELTQLQFELVENAAGMTKVGGTIVYSTCSLLREENEDQVERFLKELELELDPIEAWEVKGFEDCLLKGIVRIWPGDDRDGFFVSRFRRVKK